MEVKSSDFSDVFVSYRRKDVEFTKQLVAELQKAGKECWIDWEDIPPGSVGFSDDIKRGLEGADAFIAILTPDYLESPYCMDLELKYAVELKKKLIPIVLKKFDGYEIPADISHINWIYFTPHAGHENLFEESMPKVLQVLDTDLEHVRAHKRLLLRALEWDSNERKSSYLLRGNVLVESEAWIAAAANKSPDPTELQARFVLESRKAATAQQHRLLTLAGVAVVVMAILSIFAGWQWRVAENNKRIAESNEQLALINAEESRSLALAASSQLNLNNNNLDLAVALALQGSSIENPPQDTVLVLDEAAHLPGTRYVLAGHTGNVNAVAIHPDDERVLSASSDGTVRLWNIKTGEQIAIFEGHESAVNTVVLSLNAEQAFSCDDSGTTIVWNVADVTEVRRFESDHEACNDLLVMPDGESLLAAYNDRTLILWDIEMGEISEQNNDHLNPIGSLALSADGTRYASAENDSVDDNPIQIIVWDVETGDELGRLENISGNVIDFDFSADGQDIFVALDSTGIIQRWNIESGEIVQSLIGHISRTGAVRIFANGALAVTGSPDNTAALWKLDNSTEVQSMWQFVGHGSAVFDLAVTSDGNTLVTASADDTLRVWDIQNSTVRATGFGHQGFAENIVLAADGDRAFSISQRDDNIFAWDTATGSVLAFDDDIQSARISGLVYNAPTKTIMTTNRNGEVFLIDAETGDTIYDLSGLHSGWVPGLSMTPNGQLGFSADRNSVLAIYDLTDGSISDSINLAELLEMDRYRPLRLAVNNAGTIVAITSSEGVVTLLDISTQEVVQQLNTSASGWAIQFTPDDSLIAIGLSNRQIELFDVESGNLQRTFIGHNDSLDDLAFIDEGQFLISAADDQTVRLWRVADGEQLRRVTLFAPIYGLDVTNDGSLVAVSLNNGLVHFINLSQYSVDELIAWVGENRYQQDFTCDEIRVYRLNIENPDCS
ncbi:MAG: TIR domain-containing protein [Anaerolineae bacterium]|nr:TIR domain-containing protein [Anaerolineae bacterium]